MQEENRDDCEYWPRIENLVRRRASSKHSFIRAFGHLVPSFYLYFSKRQ